MGRERGGEGEQCGGSGMEKWGEGKGERNARRKGRMGKNEREKKWGRGKCGGDGGRWRRCENKKDSNRRRQESKPSI